jgi:AcrR family transcriptional regulator
VALGSVLSTEVRKSGDVPSRKNLTRERVLSRAAELLTADGVQEFSLRRLADDLSVASPAITWHVGTRDALLLEVVEQFLGDLVLPQPQGQPLEDYLRLFASTFRSAILESGQLGPIVLDLLPLARPSLDMSAAVIDALYDAGHRDAQLFQLHNAFLGYVLGMTNLEVRQRSLTLLNQVAPDVRARIEAAAKTHPSPQTRRMFAVGPVPSDFSRLDDASALDSSFRLGLDALLRGLPRPRSRRRRK